MRWVTGKSADEILEEMSKVAQPGSIVFEQQKAGIQVRLVGQLTESLRRMTEDHIHMMGDLYRAIDAHTGVTSRRSWVLTALTIGLVLASAVQVWKLLTH